MDELTNQLRQLGEAAEAAITPVTAGQIVASHAGPDDAVLDLDQAVAGSARPSTGQGRKRNGVWLAAAAALIVLAAGSAIFIGRTNDTQATLETASAQTNGTDDFAIPEDDNGWESLRFCESTGNYDIDAGNTFYGAYQFTREYFRETAERLELDEFIHMNPAKAPPEIQDAIANAIYLERGRDPWPICGREFSGAQVTPVVPQWIGQDGLGSVETIMFMDPTVTRAQSDVAESELDRLVQIESYTFVDKQEAYEEFQEMFADDQQIQESVAVQDMPPSYRIKGELTSSQVARLRGLPGVFEVVGAEGVSRFDPAPPMKISIPAIELTAPIYPSASTENLERGAVVLGGNVIAPSIAGFGSVEGSVFARIDELREGDLIDISYLIRPDELMRRFEQVTTQMVRTYRVINVDNDGPAPILVQDLPPWSSVERQGLTLVADVGGDALLRVVVETEITDPETSGYGIQDDS